MTRHQTSRRAAGLAAGIATLALALPAGAAAERLPIFEIVATGTTERTWDVPRTAVTERDCVGQELIEGAGRQLETWTSLPLRVKVTRWRDGTPRIVGTAGAGGDVTRTARLQRIFEPGNCSHSGPRVENQAGDGKTCGTTRYARAEVGFHLSGHRFYASPHGELPEGAFDDCPLYEDSGTRNIEKLAQRQLRSRKRIVLTSADTIRHRQQHADDANMQTTVEWTVRLERVGWHRWSMWRR